jgi:hypothetical protein
MTESVIQSLIGDAEGISTCSDPFRNRCRITITELHNETKRNASVRVRYGLFSGYVCYVLVACMYWISLQQYDGHSIPQ